MRHLLFSLSIFFGIGLLAACQKDEETHPTDWDINWFEIQDKPGELNHLIYKVYQQTGIPIFYNDTIGSQIVDYDYEGNPILHYEQLRPGYTIQSYTDEVQYVLSSDTLSLLVAVQAFLDHVIPELPEAVFSRSYLLADSLITIGWSGIDEWFPIDKAAESYLTTTVIGRIAGLKEKTEAEINIWAANLVGDLLVNYIQKNYDEQLAQFYALSYTKAGKSKYRSLLVGLGNSRIAQNWGFIDFAHGHVTPSESEDVSAYVAVFYNGQSEQEFKEKFADWPKVLQKYDLMKEIVADIRTKARGKKE